MTDSDNKEPIIQPEDAVEIKAEDQTPAEAIPEQMVMATPSEIGAVVKEEMKELTAQVTALSDQVLAAIEAVKPAPTEIIPAETILPEPEPVPEKTVETSIQVLTDKVVELTDQVKAVVEVTNPAQAEEIPPAPTTLETIRQEVTAQVIAAAEEYAAVLEEAATKAEVKAEAKLEEVKTHVTETIVTEMATQAAASLTATPANGNGKLVNVVAKSMTLLTLIVIAGMVAFAVLYFIERSKNAELIETNQTEKAQLVEKYEKTIAENNSDIKDLSTDLVSIHVVKNENIETAIQKEIDRLEAEGLPSAKAIPTAYIDDKVIEEAMYDLPKSVLKRTYVKDLITSELSRISKFAERELQKESSPALPK